MIKSIIVNGNIPVLLLPIDLWRMFTARLPPGQMPYPMFSAELDPSSRTWDFRSASTLIERCIKLTQD